MRQHHPPTVFLQQNAKIISCQQNIADLFGGIVRFFFRFTFRRTKSHDPKPKASPTKRHPLFFLFLLLQIAALGMQREWIHMAPLFSRISCCKNIHSFQENVWSSILLLLLLLILDLLQLKYSDHLPSTTYIKKNPLYSINFSQLSKDDFPDLNWAMLRRSMSYLSWEKAIFEPRPFEARLLLVNSGSGPKRPFVFSEFPVLLSFQIQ